MQISLDNVSYTYDSGTPFARNALERTTIKLNTGCWTAIAGHTGSGKSTFVQLLKGLNLPTKGQVQVGNQVNTPTTQVSKALINEAGIVFQNPEQQFFSQSVYQELSVGPEYLGWSKAEITTAVEDVIHRMRIQPEWLERSPFSLSGGQQRRVAIASVLIMNPKVLILDEPTAGLDPQSKVGILEDLKTWQEQGNKTILMITHSMDDLAEYADQVVVFHQGSPVIQATPFQLFQRTPEELKQLGLTYPAAVAFLNKLNTQIQNPIPFLSVKREDIIKQIELRSLQKAL